MNDPEKTANGDQPTRARHVSRHGPARATVAIAFVHGMLAGLRQAGRDPAALLARAQLAPELLGEATARVPVDRYAELYNLTNQELDDEGFALFSLPMRVGTFEFLCRSVITAPTLAEAIARSIRFLRLLLPDLTVGLVSDAEQARLIIEEARPLSVGRIFAFEWLLRLLHGLFSWLVGRNLVLDSVSFPYPRPPHADDYALIYTAQSRFDAPRLAASFAASLLDLPVRRDEAALQAFLDGAPGKLTTLYRRDREMVQRVRNVLRESLPGAPSQAAVAHSLHLSPRTLHRRLEEEGSCFQAVKDALLRDLAIDRLEKSSLAIARIAAELGFADTAAFYRAFRRWTGMGPAGYRRRLQSVAQRQSTLPNGLAKTDGKAV
ncbi:MAG TPA: AraC family transcriptional regulator [Accumulibacter sp.]|uniref:AraC family transcriptional regulator n=1 Tax=Accumulibacter sp. TaxID=2053492 RepID=UPI002B51872C|nr:AraC family transcriptional regulator [Accumulibacter sp.]HND38316.1 AraC family transcriptional regulator [Accumulibacter sp.]